MAKRPKWAPKPEPKQAPKPASIAASKPTSRLTKADLELERTALTELLAAAEKVFSRLEDLPEFKPGGEYRRWYGSNVTRLRNRITDELILEASVR